MTTLPKEYLDRFSPEGNLQVSVEGGRLELSTLRAPQCFNGSADAPIAIGLEGGAPGGHYIIAARINSRYSQDEEAFAAALTQCFAKIIKMILAKLNLISIPRKLGPSPGGCP